MTSGRTLLIAICLAAVAAGQAQAEIRNAYFSEGKKLEGQQIYRTEGDLPGPAKVLEAGQDQAVYLWVIFGDLDPHMEPTRSR